MASGVAGSAVPRRVPRVVQAEVDGDVVLMSPRDFHYFGLAGTGEAVWALVDGSRSVDAIVAELAERFDADPADIRRQTGEFLDALASAGLVDWAP